MDKEVKQKKGFGLDLLLPKSLVNVQNINNAPMVKLKGGLKLKLNMAFNFNNVLLISDGNRVGNFAKDVAVTVAKHLIPATPQNDSLNDVIETGERLDNETNPELVSGMEQASN